MLPATIEQSSNAHSLKFAASDGVVCGMVQVATINGWLNSRFIQARVAKYFFDASTALTTAQLKAQNQFRICGYAMLLQHWVNWCHLLLYCALRLSQSRLKLLLWNSSHQQYRASYRHGNFLLS